MVAEAYHLGNMLLMVATGEHDANIDGKNIFLIPTGYNLGFCSLTLRNQFNQASTYNFLIDFW